MTAAADLSRRLPAVQSPANAAARMQQGPEPVPITVPSGAGDFFALAGSAQDSNRSSALTGEGTDQRNAARIDVLNRRTQAHTAREKKK
jgi:GTP cyclohydrolase III